MQYKNKSFYHFSLLIGYTTSLFYFFFIVLASPEQKNIFSIIFLYLLSFYILYLLLKKIDFELKETNLSFIFSKKSYSNFSYKKTPLKFQYTCAILFLMLVLVSSFSLGITISESNINTYYISTLSIPIAGALIAIFYQEVEKSISKS